MTNPMKNASAIILACALAIPVLAQDTTTNIAAGTGLPANAEIPPPIVSFVASDGTLTAPLILTNDYIVLPGDQAELAAGGKATFNFSVTNTGNYVIEAFVNAPDESSNSFFLNIDAQLVDPDMIWDIPVTSGFEKCLVSWRGNGDSSTDQFTPKVFKLDAGAHNLILIGREPGTLLKSLSIHPAPPEKTVSP